MQWLQHHWYRFTPLHLLLYPLSLLFGLLAAARRALYQSSALPGERLPVPVIVVGNISVGGTGKTPFTLWLAQQLLDAGWHPGIISRGHGGDNARPRAVQSDDDPSISGDEPLLMAQRALCPVWIGRNRPAAGRALLAAHPECDIILSDDGLQHYRLARDLEIVLIDGDRRFGNGLLLPAGPLREPISRLDTLDFRVVNGGPPDPGEYAMQLVAGAFYNLLNPETRCSAADLVGLRLHAVAGIGHPERFFRQLQSMGLKVQKHSFPDHHRFSPADLDFPDAEAILMTEKDAVKCAAFADERCWALRVDARPDARLAQLILDKLSFHGR